MAKHSQPTGANPIPKVPQRKNWGGCTRIASHPPGTPDPFSYLARRDMVLSPGHIHRSELPPTTASVIAGCREDARTSGASLGTPVLRR